jgi:cytochrome c553
MATHFFLTRLLTVAGLFSALGGAFAQTPALHPSPTVDLVAQLKAAQANPAQLEALIKSGAKVATFCDSCHGEGGNSVKREVPNLAGQNAAYLLEAMRQYMDGSRTDTEFKRRLIKVLSPQEKIGLNLYYAHQSVVEKPAPNPGLAARGQVVYQKECAECHEDDGRGTEKIARVAGQQTVYLGHTLNAYRVGSSTRLSKQMTKTMRQLSDADVAAVVAYMGSMK